MSRDRLFGSLLGLVFLVNLARIVYAPLVEPLRAAFDVDPGTIGLVVTLVWVGSAMPRIPTGYLLTRYPRHRIVIATGGVLTGAAALATFANSPLTLGGGALLMGLASGAYFVAANPLVSELFPQRVGRAMGVHGASTQVAAVLAAPLVTVALYFGSWRYVFGAIAVTAAVVTVVLWTVARRTELPAASGVDRNFRGAVRSQWRLILFGIVLLGSVGFVWQGVFNFFVSYLESPAVALPGETARNVLTVVFLAGVPAFWLSGRLADRLPHVPYMLTIIGAFVLSVFAVTAAPNLPALVILAALMGLVIHSLFPAIDAYLLSRLPDEYRGGAYAAYSGGMMVVQSTGSAAVGALVDAGLAYATIFRGLAGGLSVVLLVLVVFALAGRIPDEAAPGPVETG